MSLTLASSSCVSTEASISPPLIDFSARLGRGNAAATATPPESEQRRRNTEVRCRHQSADGKEDAAEYQRRRRLTGWEAESPPQGVALLGRQAITLDIKVCVDPAPSRTCV